MAPPPTRETEEALARVALKNLRFERRTTASDTQSHTDVAVHVSTPGLVLT